MESQPERRIASPEDRATYKTFLSLIEGGSCTSQELRKAYYNEKEKIIYPRAVH